MFQTFLSQFPPFELNAFWISQILIGLAFLSDTTSWQFKKREIVLSFLVISCLLIGTHYVLLNEITGAVMLYLAALRYFVSIFTTKKIWIWIFLALIFVSTYFSYENTNDLFIFVANIFFNTAAFQEKDKRLRELVMAGMPFLILYNVLVFSPAAIVLESFFLLSNMIGYWRFYLRKNLSSK
jgi:hypothetical protein